jgi:hypothetical protein
MGWMSWTPGLLCILGQGPVGKVYYSVCAVDMTKPISSLGEPSKSYRHNQRISPKPETSSELISPVRLARGKPTWFGSSHRSVNLARPNAVSDPKHNVNAIICFFFPLVPGIRTRAERRTPPKSWVIGTPR